MTDRRDEPPMRAAPSKARIDASVRRRLGQDLRLFYGGVLGQPLPERFTRLLEALSATPATQEESRDRERSR